MGRYPDLAIRIDVEHEIVNPVAENYDIVFAMLEAPLPSTGIVIRQVSPSSVGRGLFVRAFAAGKIRRAPHPGRSCQASDADRPQ